MLRDDPDRMAMLTGGQTKLDANKDGKISGEDFAMLREENKEKREATDIFEVMEKRLFFYIMRPAMIFTWVFGLVLIYLNGIDIFSQLWFQIKIVLIILLSAYNDYLGKCLVALKNSTNTKSAKFFRIINEIPTAILIIVVFLAIFKPI